MLFVVATTACALMLPCTPIQIPSAATRNHAPPQMNLIEDAGSWLATAVAALVILSSVYVVEPGEVGIVATLGSISPVPLEAGFHVTSPLANVQTFSVKTSLAEESTTVPTKEGLSIELDTALLYRLDPDKVQSLILSVGSGFERVVIQPELRSIVRGLTSEVAAKSFSLHGRTRFAKVRRPH